MDQSSLAALLNQLKGLEEPSLDVAAPKPADKTSGSDDADDAAPSKDVVSNGLPLGEAVDKRDTNDDGKPLLTADQSELERLLGDLRSNTLQFAGPDRTDALYGETDGTYFPQGDPARLSSAQEAQQRDLRKLTFVQALPILSHLSGDPDFIQELQQIKSDQEALELSLVDERNKKKAEFDKQLKAAQQAATSSGTPYELDRVNKLMNTALTKFDRQALARWDKMGTEVQIRLEKLGVPCFYPLTTNDPVAKQRQKRVMEVLVQLLDDP